MNKVLTNADLKRRGVAAIEDALRFGPVHIVKRKQPAAVVLTPQEYERLAGGKPPAETPSGLTALQWLLAQPCAGTRDKADLDTALAAERDW